MEYLETENQPRLIKLLFIRQIEFKDIFKEKSITNYIKNILVNLQGEIGYIDIYKENKLFSAKKNYTYLKCNILI